MRRRAVAILKGDFAGYLGSGRKQSHDGERGDGLSRARFANQRKHFAGSDRKRKCPHRSHGVALSARLRELDGQVADIKQRSHEEYGISAETTSFLAAIPVAPFRPRGNKLQAVHSVRRNARAVPTPYRKVESADSRTDRRSDHSNLCHPSA